MGERVVSVITDGSASIERVVAACERLGVRTRTTDVRDVMGSTEPRGSLGPVLARVGSGTRVGEMYALADRMLRSLRPGVLLVEPGRMNDAGALHAEGLIVVDDDAMPEAVAAMLYALAERQKAVRALSAELELATRSQGGVHGEMSRLHEELNLAALVQQELLPRELPRVPGFEFGVVYRPAGYVSGDIYDVALLPDGRISFFIADAVGHGVPAALMTMVISRSLRQEASKEGGGTRTSPGLALTRLNAELAHAGGGGGGGTTRFATAVQGVIDPTTRRVTLAVAGHPSPILLRRPGSSVLVEACAKADLGGPLLGVFPDERFEEMAFTLAPGETLIVLSDGFETAFPEENRAGTRRYLDELARVRWPGPDHDASLAQALGDLTARLDAQDGSLHRIDDVTAIVIAALATPTRARLAA